MTEKHDDKTDALQSVMDFINGIPDEAFEEMHEKILTDKQKLDFERAMKGIDK